jgi:hypothetical protein
MSDSFLDLLDRPRDVSFFEKSESPHPVARVAPFISFLALFADLDGFSTKSMDIVDVSKGDISMGVFRVDVDALLKILFSFHYIFLLKLS